MNKIILYSETVSPRLDYAARYIFEDLMGLALRWTSSAEEFAAADTAKISLQNNISETPYLYVDDWILHPSSEILSETELEDKWQGVMFTVPSKFWDSGKPLLDFDIFSAVFFLLSRYEEYRSDTVRDNFGRFCAASSYLYRTGALQKPVINIWTSMLHERLKHIFPSLKFTLPQFEIFPTIDIDHGFLVKNKPLYKQMGGLIKYPKQFFKRLSVMFGVREDPYFNLPHIVELHRSLELKSKLFFHCANYKNGIDNANALPSKKYAKLLKSFNGAEDIEVGLHLSYNAASIGYTSLANNEKSILERFALHRIYSNRNHFLALILPKTYRMLESVGIINDYTMGFADDAGFRAGCCTPFHWYDLKNESKTSLKIFPLTCMDTTFFKYLHCTEDEAFERMTELREKVRVMNGVFIPLFHNETLAFGGQKMWRRYEKLLSE
jgi:hypothetical protein